MLAGRVVGSAPGRKASTVPKSPTWHREWKYLYESAVKAWEKLEYYELNVQRTFPREEH